MPNLNLRIVNAVTVESSSSSQFYAAIDLPDEQQLGAPASEEEILELERHLGLTLPLRTAAFLSLYNGWRMVDAETDLLTIEEMLAGGRADKIRQWQMNAANGPMKLAVMDWSSGFLILVRQGLSSILAGPSNDREWRLFENYKDEEQEFDSFIDWLEQSVADYQELAVNPNAGQDEDEEE